MNTTVSNHYDQNYFSWQGRIGEFGGWANLSKFAQYIKKSDRLMDFGCGGGYLLDQISCKSKIGVEVNLPAAKIARKKGLKVYVNLQRVKNESIDVIISNNVLEHTLQPLIELKELYKKLRKGGKIIFVVPCESISYAYRPGDVNHHLYGWSPMALGNLFTEAGFKVLESKPYIHKWPPHYGLIAKLLGREWFDRVCRLYGQIERSWFQVRVVAKK